MRAGFVVLMFTLPLACGPMLAHVSERMLVPVECEECSVDDNEAALCHTDEECALFCPEGTRDLPPDHPDYCDGGPRTDAYSWEQP